MAYNTCKLLNNNLNFFNFSLQFLLIFFQLLFYINYFLCKVSQKMTQLLYTLLCRFSFANKVVLYYFTGYSMVLISKLGFRQGCQLSFLIRFLKKSVFPRLLQIRSYNTYLFVYLLYFGQNIDTFFLKLNNSIFNELNVYFSFIYSVPLIMFRFLMSLLI